MIQEAFFDVCKEAEPARGCYLSLYVSVPFCGGPEEGGWWGQDTHLVASQWFPSGDDAEAAFGRVKGLAEELSEQARREFGRRCVAEMDWLEARGLEPEFLPEVDGEEQYWVRTEEVRGESERNGCRHYE